MVNLWIARLFEQLDLKYYYCVVMVHLLYIATEPFNVHIVWLCFQFFTSITLFHPILNFHCHEFQWLTWTPLKDAKTGKLKVHCHKKSKDQSWPNYHLCFPAILGRRLGTWLIHSPYAAAREKTYCPHQWFEDYLLYSRDPQYFSKCHMRWHQPTLHCSHLLWCSPTNQLVWLVGLWTLISFWLGLLGLCN